MAPQPLSNTASGGQIMQIMALRSPIYAINGWSKVLKKGINLKKGQERIILLILLS
jgi:hypothetical protein